MPRASSQETQSVLRRVSQMARGCEAAERPKLVVQPPPGGLENQCFSSQITNKINRYKPRRDEKLFFEIVDLCREKMSSCFYSFLSETDEGNLKNFLIKNRIVPYTIF